MAQHENEFPPFKIGEYKIVSKIELSWVGILEREYTE